MTGSAPSPRADSAGEESTESTSGGDRTVAQSRSRSVKLFIRDILIIFVCAVVISVGIKAFLIRSFYIPSGSMENTLQIQDRIIVNELVPDLVPLERGDVVVFRDPGGWLDTLYVPPAANPVAGAIDWFLTLVGLSASDTNDHLIKRVIGLPGDTVACCNEQGQVEVNGIPLDEPYLKEPQLPASRDPFSVTVPDDAIWVLGDNRNSSADSRLNTDTPSKGFVPIENVVGRAFVVTWPFDHWTWLDNYPGTFDVVAKEND